MSDDYQTRPAMKWRPETFIKKPVTIQAWRLTRDNIKQVAEWCGGQAEFEEKPSDPTDVHWWLDIPTLEGVMKGSLGDYVIRGVKGEFYACKPDIFEATYTRPTRRARNE